MLKRFTGLIVLATLLLVSCNTGSRTPVALQQATIAPTTLPLPTAAQITATTLATSTSQVTTGDATTASPTTTEATTSSATASSPATLVPPPQPVQVPQGFVVSVYAEKLGSPRGLALGPDGRVYMTDIQGGRVLRFSQTAGADGLYAGEVVVKGLDEPHGITFHDNQLYVGETNQIDRFQHQGDGWGPKQVIIPNLPTGGHRTRTVLFGTDGKLYVAVGSSCNVCEEKDPRRAAVWQYNADGSGGRLYTKGLRNAVGLALRPSSDAIWATTNGRDMLGDDLPPETINILADGADFGWPRCHAGRIVDPDHGSPNTCQGTAKPAVEMQAHSAPLGLAFYTGKQFPAAYQGSLFVAFHGSWNRTAPTGYKIVRIPVDANGKAGPVQDFAVGWLNGTAVWGR
ncbi:MAG: PQQ-dependent sugar dehydrogenase, partial [Herpetosiphonaceae bacterium]|nr:PQQ-dependent sugar dehydrogenase [Herpetosiphonaceae bacterium]